MKIGVHSGTFHADDVLSVCLLKELDEYKDATVIRTRDQAVLDQCDIVCDVGGVYNHETKRYDHHQPEHEFQFPGSKVRTASCGLIYFHYGLEIITKLVKELKFEEYNNDEDMNMIWKIFYRQFVEEIDGFDNGISPADVEPNYSVHTGISRRIERLNPHWRESDVDPDARFIEAVAVMRDDVMRFLRNICSCLYPTVKAVRQGFDARFDTHPSGRVIELPRKLPFSGSLNHLEAELGKENEILYAIIPRQEGEQWTIQCANKPGTMIPRKPLCWRTLSPVEQAEKIKEACGIEDLVFIHKSGFLGVVKSRESAMKWLTYQIEKQDE